MSPPSVMRIFSGNNSSLRTAKKVLCMHIIIFTQFFQLSKNSTHLATFVSSGCELKPRFPYVHSFLLKFLCYSYTSWKEQSTDDIRQFLQCEYTIPQINTSNIYIKNQRDATWQYVYY
jgi:hypothetical protein